MSTQPWTQLVQHVDLLIIELKKARAEAKQWRSRATELERLNLTGTRTSRLEEQTKERELDRLRRERKKVIESVTKLIQELEQAQRQIMEKEPHE